jgi:predicted RNA-binding Zn ribbon-like protein
VTPGAIKQYDQRVAGERAFRFGAGRPSLDLIRTLRYRGRPGEVEELPSAARWDAWLRRAGLGAPADADPARAAAARELREHIAGLLGAVAERGLAAVRRADLAAVNAAAAHPVPVPRLGADGGLRHASEDPGAAVRSLLARDALDVAARTDPARLRRCANPGCRTLFIDTSRPGSRRWCAMAGCGDRAKKAEQRARDRGRDPRH